MVKGRGKGKGKGKAKNNDDDDGNETGGNNYEEIRARKMKENKERMDSLGILDLKKTIAKPEKKSPSTSSSSSSKIKAQSDPPPTRRSPRLKDVPPVNYFEKKPKELYTEEHDKLLGDCVTPWTPTVDEGEPCHQCGQRTLGPRTKCSECKAATGQLCGNCLFMRYGENVNEANEKPNWVCPVCRGICNCAHCRRENGWAPTARSIYKTVKDLGFKSVAHYLISTFRENGENRVPPHGKEASGPSSSGIKLEKEENENEEENAGDESEKEAEDDS